MRRIVENSENEVILNSIYELTRTYDDGQEVPTYFNINEITDNYGLTNKEVIDLAQSHGYNVYRIPGNDSLVTSIIIAHEGLSYGDIVKEDTTKVDIKELGDSTDDSFNMEEDMEEVKPWGYKKIYEQLKEDTINFTKVKGEFSYSFEEECKFAYKILSKKYEDVDYWFVDDWFSPFGESWHITFEGPLRGKKKIVKEDTNSNPLIGKHVKFNGVDFVIGEIEEEDGDILFTISNKDGSKMLSKTAIDKGTLTSDDEEVVKYFDSIRTIEEPKEDKVEIEEPKETKSDDEIYREKAREDFYASNKLSQLYRDLDRQLRKGGQLASYEMAYYKEYTRLLNSPIEKARRRTNNSNITISKTYKGDVDELINWLKRAISRIDVFTNEDNKDEINSIVNELNAKHNTNYEAKVNTSKDGDQFVATITSDESILKDMPEEFKTWVAPKNLGLHRANAEKVDALVYNDKNRRLTSNGIIKDLLYNYDFKLGDYKEKNESIARMIYDDSQNKKANNKKVKIIYGSSPKEAKANKPIKVTLKQLDNYKDNYSYVEIIDESLDSSLDELSDRIASYLDEKDIDAWVEETNRECVDVGTDNEEDFNKIKSVLDEKGITYEDISGGAPKYWGVRVWPNLNEDIDELIYKVAEKLKNNINSFEDELMTLSQIEGVDVEEIKQREPIKIAKALVEEGIVDFRMFENIEKEYYYNYDVLCHIYYKGGVIHRDEEAYAKSYEDLCQQVRDDWDYEDDLEEVEEYGPIEIKVNYTDDPKFKNEDDDLEEDIEKYKVKYQNKSKEDLNKLFNKVKKEVDDLTNKISKVDVTKAQKLNNKLKELNDELTAINYLYQNKKQTNEDIEKHDELNPKLFDGEELKPEVKDAIQNIANEFIKELNEDGVNFTLKDIVLLGSNVSYNYTKDSDLDIHLIADSSGLDCPQSLIDKLYGAYRSIFNKNYDITIKDIPAEIYVELDEPRARSNGIYSLNNGWIKRPEVKDIPDLDEEAFDKLFTIWEDDYFDLLDKLNMN